MALGFPVRRDAARDESGHEKGGAEAPPDKRQGLQLDYLLLQPLFARLKPIRLPPSPLFAKPQFFVLVFCFSCAIITKRTFVCMKGEYGGCRARDTGN